MPSNVKGVKLEKVKAVEYWVESDEEVGGKLVAHNAKGHHLFKARDSVVRFFAGLRLRSATEQAQSPGGKVVKYRLCTGRYTVAKTGWE